MLILDKLIKKLPRALRPTRPPPLLPHSQPLKARSANSKNIVTGAEPENASALRPSFETGETTGPRGSDEGATGVSGKGSEHQKYSPEISDYVGVFDSLLAPLVRKNIYS